MPFFALSHMHTLENLYHILFNLEDTYIISVACFNCGNTFRGVSVALKDVR